MREPPLYTPPRNRSGIWTRRYLSRGYSFIASPPAREAMANVIDVVTRRARCKLCQIARVTFRLIVPVERGGEGEKEKRKRLSRGPLTVARQTAFPAKPRTKETPRSLATPSKIMPLPHRFLSLSIYIYISVSLFF